MRVVFAILLSLGISLGIFFTMHLMTSSSNANVKKETKTRHLVFLREKKDTTVERKKRVKPKQPPKKQPPKKIKIVKTTIKAKVNQNVKIKPFQTKVMKNIDISAISSLDGAQIDLGGDLFNASSLEAIKRVSPKYPRRAKMKKIKSGFVELQFTISKDGKVSNVKVLNSNPSDIFDKSAIKAIKKWLFKKNEEQREATIKFNYRVQ